MNDLIKKISGFKVIGFIILAFIAGVVLLLWPSGEKTAASTAYIANEDDYIAKAEKQAEALICKIEGVKSCDVMISISDGYSYLYASDQKVKVDGENKDVEKEVVIITSDGKQSPIVICEYTPKIAGIAVVYDGNSNVTEQIRVLLATLFKLSNEYIYVTN